MTPEILQERIAVARGEEPAALVVKNAQIFQLTTGEMEKADIAITRDGVIAGIGRGYSGVRELDARGLVAVPGFIDAHIHVESSLMTPAEYERCVLRHGVTTAVCDPHELANVIGPDAFTYYIESAKALTMDLIVRLSSCVPATNLETSGATIDADTLAAWHERYPELGLGEFMNVPGVQLRIPEILKKLATFSFIDGHCPNVDGRALNAYAACGVRNCHESCSLDEAQEKIRRGMQIFIREGSAACNLEALLPLLTPENAPFLAFCTDDRNPLDMLERGHIDAMISRVLAAGVPPLVAYRVASFSAARGLGLTDRGLIAPGLRADIVLLSDLSTCHVEDAVVNGVPLNEIHYKPDALPSTDSFRNTVKSRRMTAADFSVLPTSGVQPVIGIANGSLLTDYLHLTPQDDDVLPVAVIERHGKGNHVACAYIHGFGLQKGAIASSVGHDSHNLCVVGTNPEDMAVAINALCDMQGGFAVACWGSVTATVPLPLGGLFSDAPAEELIEQLLRAREAVRALGCPLDEPFLQLAFVPLPVIPHLKLTDKGLVDVDAFAFVK